MERPAARPSLIAALGGFALAGLLGREAVALPVLMPPAPEAGVAVWVTALVGLLGAVAGALGKWLLEQWGAQRAADRAFAASATQQVVDLAQKYYWSLANHAGSLGMSLTGHVQMRAVHIILGGNDAATLKRQLDEMSKPVAEDTFPTFCRLVSLFDEFQFRGSNTYLLQSHFAGETCRRLYNAFVEALSLDEETGSLQTLKIAAVMRAPLPESLSGRSEKCIGELPSQVFMDEIVPIQLRGELEAWKAWLRDRTPEVVIAADALRTYSELLSHELAQLYETFFGRSGIARFTRGEDTVERYRETVEADRWPRILRPRSLALIEVVSLRPSLLKPLGRGLIRPEREPEAPFEHHAKAEARKDLGKEEVSRARPRSQKSPAPQPPVGEVLRAIDQFGKPETEIVRHG